MPELDLDAIRAAEREQHREPPTIVLGGVRWTLPVEMPFPIVEALGRLDRTKGHAANLLIEEIFRGLLGEQYAPFMRENPSVLDMAVLVEHLPELYGVPSGESTASGSSSTPIGEPSRPTSSDSTE